MPSENGVPIRESPSKGIDQIKEDAREELKLRLANAIGTVVERDADLFRLSDGVLLNSQVAEERLSLPPGPSYLFSAVSQATTTIELRLYDAFGNLVDSGSGSGGVVLRAIRVTHRSVDVRLVATCSTVPCYYGMLTVCVDKSMRCGIGLKDLYRTYGSWEAIVEAQGASDDH